MHIPACISSAAMMKLVADSDRPEGFAQCRAVGGGLGVGMATLALLWKGDWDRLLTPPMMKTILRSPLGKALAYLIAGWAMIRCYGLLAPGLHRRLKRAVSSSRILLGVLPPRCTIDVMLHGKTAAEYWDKKEKNIIERPQPPPVAGRKLVRALLEQREETERLVQVPTRHALSASNVRIFAVATSSDLSYGTYERNIALDLVAAGRRIKLLWRFI
ncbi:hypothetical protein BDZ89DRAFT_1040654 [Hymenopellis radicata]|nr:hypothetical protein BDZ89DRAFT_1040654 [Hymenopellis radicata]